MIEIRELYKYYDNRKAVGPLSFDIEPGEIVGLLGLNGAGKTTTLRILACDLLPSSGSVRVGGIDVVENPHEVRKRIGYLPDTPPLYSEMTVAEYLAFAARLRGLSKSDGEKRVAEVLSTVQLGQVADDLISSLSHGYKQRVGIAQAVVHRPKLLVLDEPITGLDPVQIVEMRALLKSLKGEHTIVLSSHILSEISETCDRILLVQNGTIAASGTEAELTAKLRNRFQTELVLRGDQSTVMSIVEGMEEVTEVVSLPSYETGQDVFSIGVESDSDVRESICQRLVEEKVGILGVWPRQRLESIFLTVTEQADQAAAASRRAS